MERGKLGFGVYKITDEKKLEIALETAFDIGYKHIDTASYYNNEEIVGKFLKKHPEIYVTTKIWPGEMSEHKIENAFNRSLKYLGKIDLLLLHWPHPKHFVKAYKYMEKLYKQGIVGNIGVSNFEISHLEELKKHSDILPYVNQIELHPKLAQKEIREYNKKNGIITEAWAPIGRAKYLDDEILVKIARDHDATTAQIMLAWEIANGIYPIPKSENPLRIISNFKSKDIILTKEEMKILDSMDINKRLSMHPLEFPYE